MKTNTTTVDQTASPITAHSAATGLARRAGITLVLRMTAFIALTVTIASVAATANAALTRAQACYKFPSTLGYSSPSRILSRMTSMFTPQWKPVTNFSNWRYSGTPAGVYVKGTTYYGLPYSQANPPTDAAGFIGYLPAMAGVLSSTDSVSVDCSASICIAWELPKRLATTDFDKASTWFTTVVQPGTLALNAAKILPGDAIVSSAWGHMILVKSAPVNGKVACLEATSDQGLNSIGGAQRWAVVANTRSLSDLDVKKCRCIRRNLLQ